MPKILVYGTLKKGYHGNVSFLSNNKLAKFVGQAVTESGWELRDIGPYPAAVHASPVRLVGGTGVNSPSPPHRIRGEVYEVTDELIKYLDEYEGYPYLYNRIEVNTTKGKCIMYVFVDEGAIAGYPVCENGEWKHHEKA